MPKNDFLSPVFIKYQDAFDQNPRSRVFAPLAEAYRKMGMMDKAFKILKTGIRIHPDYILGHMTLAACYIDIDKFNLAYAALRPFVASSRDNIKLQKLFARCSFDVGNLEEALETYKYLLFINPKDEDSALKVTELEKQFDKIKFGNEFEHNAVDLFARNDNLFDVDDLKIFPQLEEEETIADWVQLDITNDTAGPQDGLDEWVMADSAHENEIITDDELVVDVVNSEGDRTYQVDTADVPAGNISDVEAVSVEDEKNAENDTVINDQVQEKAAVPFVTLTLVDLYLAQGLRDKAKEVLLKIIALNPQDENCILKLSQIEASGDDVNLDEAIGHEQLMQDFDQQMNPQEFTTDVPDNTDDAKGSAHNSEEYFQLVQRKLQHFARLIGRKHKEKLKDRNL